MKWVSMKLSSWMQSPVYMIETNFLMSFRKASEDVFVPIAVGGGIRTSDDVAKALDVGADKVVINTGAFKDISLVEKVANKYGSQCLVGSIEAKSIEGTWKCYTDNGREPTDSEVSDWVLKLEDAGVGEILLTSVDQEGTKRGFDSKLIEMVNSLVKKPIIASGGMELRNTSMTFYL